MNLSEILIDYLTEDDSEAVKQAKQMGLIYKGFGRWANKVGKVTHKTDNGKLVPVDPAQQEFPGMNDPEIEPHPDAATQGLVSPEKGQSFVKPRVGAPSERPEREKRFGRRQQTKQSMRNIANLAKSHDWDYEYSDDHSQWRKGEAERSKLVDTIARSGFSGEQIRDLFNTVGVQDRFTKDLWNQIEQRRSKLQGSGETVPDKPSRYDDPKYDASFRNPQKNPLSPTGSKLSRGDFAKAVKKAIDGGKSKSLKTNVPSTTPNSPDKK